MKTPASLMVFDEPMVIVVVKYWLGEAYVLLVKTAVPTCVVSCVVVGVKGVFPVPIARFTAFAGIAEVIVQVVLVVIVSIPELPQ